MRLWHNKTLDWKLIDPLLSKNNFIISSSYVHLRNVARKFLYRNSRQLTGEAQVSARVDCLLDATGTRIINGAIYASMA